MSVQGQKDYIILNQVSFANSCSASNCNSMLLQRDFTSRIRISSLILNASSRARFHMRASQNKLNLSSGTLTRSIYRIFSFELRFPFIAARAKGLNPMGGFARESASICKLFHCPVSAKALTLVNHTIFSGTRNFFAILSASVNNRCFSL